MGTTRIETNRLILRQFNDVDYIEAFNNWCNDPEVTKFLTWEPHGNLSVTKSVIDSWIVQYCDENYYQWVIELKDTHILVGSMAIVRINNGVYTIGYCIGKKFWHQGITSEAFSAVIKYLFTNTNCVAIEGEFEFGNPHSGMVMQKCGLKYYQDKDMKTKDGINKVHCYRLEKSDYENSIKTK